MFGTQLEQCLEKPTAINGYVKREERSKNNNPSLYYKNLRKEEQIKPKGSREKE